MRHTYFTTFLLCALGGMGTAHAWGTLAHAAIDRAAINALPDDGPVFLRHHVDLIADSASLPDSWRGNSEPFSKIAEDPNHGWFREQFSFLKILPRSRYAFIIALYQEHQRILKSDPDTALRMNVRWTGTLPYAVTEGYGRLVADMRLLRMKQAKGENTQSLETDCAFLVAWFGHYIADGSQPLHVTIHHDGWVGPNPKGYTRDPAVHGRFESSYPELIALSDRDVASRLEPVGHQQGDVFDLVLSYLDDAHAHVEQVYRLDKIGAFTDSNNQEGRSLVYERTAAASSMLRDLVLRAWRESALPTDAVKAAPINDPSSTGYMSATGSTSAPHSPDLSLYPNK